MLRCRQATMSSPDRAPVALPPMCSVRSGQSAPVCWACVNSIEGSLADSRDRQPIPNSKGTTRSRPIAADWTQGATRKRTRPAFDRWSTAVRSPTQTPTMHEIPNSPMGVPGKVRHMTEISTSGQIRAGCRGIVLATGAADQANSHYLRNRAPGLNLLANQGTDDSINPQFV